MHIDAMSNTVTGDVPLERLEAEIMSWAGNIAAATAQFLGWVAEYDRREGWAQWGARSCAEWLSWKCGESLHTAREKVRVASALVALPATSTAFEAGELSYSKVRAITRVACPADDADWAQQARHATGAQLDRLVAAVSGSLDADDPRAAFEKRSCVRKSGTGGTSHLRVDAPHDAVTTINAAIEVVASTMIDEAVAGSGLRRSDVIRERGGLAAIRADALLQIAEQTIAGSPAASERGDVGRLQLVADTATLSTLADEPASGTCTLDGRRIDPELARRWACDIRASLVADHDGHGCDEGRDTRVLNRRLRRALHRRDHGSCRFPGCGATSWLHAHHIVHWADGGPTNLANLVSVCGFHHRLVHEGGWAVAIVDGAIVWSDANGTPTTVEPLSGESTNVRPSIETSRISPSALEARWHRDHLDFHFAVAVITEYCLRARSSLVGVPAGTPTE